MLPALLSTFWQPVKRLDRAAITRAKTLVSWRVKAFEKMDAPPTPAQLFYTAPMSISESQYGELRKRITEVIAELNSKITQSKPEKLACLNIDLFEV